MKRAISFAVAASLLLTLSFLYLFVPEVFQPADDVPTGEIGDVFEYDSFLFETMEGEDGKYLCVTGYTGSDWFAAIPESVYDMPVREIGESAFYKNDVLLAIKFPKTMRTVARFAFAESSIAIVIANEELESIGYAAFYKCDELRVFELSYLDGLLSIGDYAFAECPKYVSAAEMPDSLLRLGAYAFQGCVAIRSVELNEGLIYIGDGTFNHCEGVKNTEIVIPASVKQIGGQTFAPGDGVRGSHVFYNCGAQSLTRFSVAEGNLYYMAVDGVLYAKNEKGEPSVLIAYPPKKADAVYEMPNTVADAYELSFGRPLYLNEILLSDAFRIYTDLPENYLNVGNNLSVAVYNKNHVAAIRLRESNTEYTAENGLLLSSDGKTLLYVPLCAGNGDTLILPDVTTILDGAICIEVGGGIADRYTAERIAIPDTLTDLSDAAIRAINDGLWDILLSDTHPTLRLQGGKLYRK